MQRENIFAAHLQQNTCVLSIRFVLGDVRLEFDSFGTFSLADENGKSWNRTGIVILNILHLDYCCKAFFMELSEDLMIGEGETVS